MTSSLQTAFAAHKYEQPPISSPTSLVSFARDYPNQNIPIKDLAAAHPLFQRVRGDGNCFYRACLYLYLCDSSLHDYGTLFPRVSFNEIRDVPFATTDFEPDFVLQFIWKKYLKPLASSRGRDREEAVRNVLGSSFLLDAYLIAYFRCLNHYHLTKNRREFEDFGDIDGELNRICCFGTESEGVELLTMAKVLRAQITVMATLETGLQQCTYDGGNEHKFLIFYRPGHYDLLCPPNPSLVPPLERKASSIRMVIKKASELRGSNISMPYSPQQQQPRKQFTSLMQFQMGFGKKVSSMSTIKGPKSPSVIAEVHNSSVYESSVRDPPAHSESSRQAYSYSQGRMSRSNSGREESDRWSKPKSGIQSQVSKVTIYKETFVLLTILGVVAWLAIQ